MDLTKRAPLKDLSQIGDKNLWKWSMWLLRVNINFMAHNQSINIALKTLPV